MTEIKIGRMVIGSVQTNCYFIYREGSKKVVCVDPADDGAYIFETLGKNGFEVEAIILTHAHFDHIWGSNELRELSHTKIYAYEAEKALCEDADMNISAQVRRPYIVIPDIYLKDLEVFTVADITFQLIATPGHTIGSCCYYIEEANMLISGDTLFAESVGRTDLPTGSSSQLMRSVREKLFALPEETAVYPGHGDQTTIGHEKKYNPFA